MVELYTDLHGVWEAFIQLNNCRTAGFSGLNPLQFSEIKMMADELEITKLDERQYFINRIIMIDRIYLTAINDDKKHNKSSKDKKHGNRNLSISPNNR